MYDPTSMAHWVMSLEDSILAVRVHQNLNVKSLFLSSLDRCFENIEQGIPMGMKTVPTNIMNLIANRAMRYKIDLSQLLKYLANSSVNKLELTNYGVGKYLPICFYKELAACTSLVHLDLYGFDLHLSQFHLLSSLSNLASLSLGCDKGKNIFSHEIINTLSCYKLARLELRNFIIDLKTLDVFPCLKTLSLSKCVTSQSSELETHPPLECVSISQPVIYFGALYIPDLTFYVSTLQTLRLSFVPLKSDNLFKSQIFPSLTELEIAFCELETKPLEKEGLLAQIHQFCPSLYKLVFLSDTYSISSESDTETEEHPFQIISRNATPPVLMELILNHFHNPETAFAIAILKPTDNTFYWGKGRMGNRATVSPHFLILSNLLYLHPTCTEASVIIDKLDIRDDLWDKKIICGEDYIIALVHYFWNGKGDKVQVRKCLTTVWNANCIDTKRREKIVTGVFKKH